LNSSMSLSQSGFSDLQWPHQGAWNLMKTVFPATAASQLSEVSSIAAAAAATSLTPDNWDAATAGKTVLIKFQAPW